jgi:hypothetical protein
MFRGGFDTVHGIESALRVHPRAPLQVIGVAEYDTTFRADPMREAGALAALDFNVTIVTHD